MKDTYTLSFFIKKRNGILPFGALLLLYLDVVCVGSLEFFPEVGVCLQHLNHLSEVTVIVQTSILRYAHTAKTKEHVNTEQND